MVAGTGVTPYRRKQRRSFELRGVPAPSNKKSLQLRAAGDILEGGIRGIAAYSGYKNAQRVDQVGKVADTYDTYVKTQDASFRTLKPSDAFAKFQESGRKGEIPTLEGVGIDDSTWDDKDLRYSVLRRQDEIGRNAVTEGLEGPLDLSQKKGSQAEILRVEGLSQEEQGPAFRKLFLDDLKARDLVDDKGNWKGDYISSDVMDRSFNHTVIKSQADQMASEGKYGAALAFVSKLEKKGSLTAKEAQSREKDILARFNNQVRFKNLLDQMKNTKDTEVIDEQAARGDRGGASV